ncbi:MAG: DUF333 domain-containing protein [Rhodobacteraceae bacterium]|nr:DUF333 domain-containing protein [Paracoccaceae bacterium]
MTYLGAAVLALGIAAASAAQADTSATQSSNPAADFCELSGNTYMSRENDNGAMVGYCLLPDGAEVDAWEYYRGQAQAAVTPITDPASEHCQQMGARYELRDTDLGTETGFCVNSDGQEMNAWDLYRNFHDRSVGPLIRF